MKLVPSLAALAATLAASSLAAEVLTLDCHVHSMKPGYQRSGIRRLQIDLAAKTVKVSDDAGRGFQVKGERPLVSADVNRIVFESGGIKQSYVDRHSGQYMFRNTTEKLTIEGHCQKASTGF